MRVSSQQRLQHAFDRFSAACDQAGTKLSTKKLRYCVSQDAEAVYSASERKYTAAGGNVQLSWGGVHEWRKSEQRD